MTTTQPTITVASLGADFKVSCSECAPAGFSYARGEVGEVVLHHVTEAHGSVCVRVETAAGVVLTAGQLWGEHLGRGYDVD